MDSIPNSRENVVPDPSSNLGVHRLNINSVRSTRENPVLNTPNSNPPNLRFEDALDIEEDIEVDPVSIRRRTCGPQPSIFDDDDIHLVNADETHQSSDAIMKEEDTNTVNEVEHPLLLLGEQEPPFVYLSSLFLRLGTRNIQSVQGKVKCCLTAVKSFKYEKKYDLRAYIDDGGMISEIIIHHDVVQKKIGHSPEGIKAHLSSPDKVVVSKIKAVVKKFQVFLSNFEGIMLIEMSKGSDLPVAREMNQGCQSSDALLLLRRLKSSALPAQTLEGGSSRQRSVASQRLSSSPIVLSP